MRVFPKARRTIAWLGLCGLLSLQACATPERLEAAGDVHALLVSIRDGDRAGFDDHIDRSALDDETQAALVHRSEAAGLGGTGAGLGVLASGPLSRVAGGLLLRPEVFRAVAYAYGYRPGEALPRTLALATVLRPQGGGRICAIDPKTGSCLLSFTRESGVWRLTWVNLRVLRKGTGE